MKNSRIIAAALALATTYTSLWEAFTVAPKPLNKAWKPEPFKGGAPGDKLRRKAAAGRLTVRW